MKRVQLLFKFILIFALVLIFTTSCNDSSTTNKIAFTSEPTFVLNPSGIVPLAGVLSVTTNVPATIKLDITDGTESWKIEFSNPDLVHELKVLGLKPDRTHEITITAVDEFGNESQADSRIQVITDPLPDDFPTIEMLNADVEKMEPGFTVVENVGTDGLNYMFIVNSKAEVVWYSSQLGLQDFKQLDNGNFLVYQTFFGPMAHDVLEMDMLGNVLRSWKTAYSDSDDPDRIEVENTIIFHHEVYPMPNGNFLGIDVELRDVDSFPLQLDFDPASASITGPATVGADVIVEFTPDGSVVKRWHLFDILDPQRVGYGSDAGTWGRLYPDTDGDGVSEASGSKAWSMANAVIYDASDDTIIVSVRHQDVVVKIDRNDTIVWMLGNPFGWDESYFDSLLDLADTQGAEWQYHQHAPQLTSRGTLLIFDNGNNRSLPFDGIDPMDPADSYSRAVEFDINPQTMEATQLWQYGAGLGDERLYADFAGDADEMPITGNILITFGGLDLSETDYATQIIEVTHDDQKEVVFRFVVYDENTYRAARISSLY